MAIKKVLILAANPLETARLRLDKEVAAVLNLQLAVREAKSKLGSFYSGFAIASPPN